MNSAVRLNDLAPGAWGTGRGVRVAVIDSGIASGHPHVGAVSPGVWIRADGLSDDSRDCIGHGTAVAAAIREKAPEAELIPVRVFDRTLATTAAALADAIVWSAGAGARLINVSLGTRNPAHQQLLVAAIHAAHAQGAIVIAAAEWQGEPCLPGALPGVIGVLAAADCPRATLQLGLALGAPLYASPFPRPIPGVPEQSNLSGVSFAVANVTGLLAGLLEGATEVSTATALHERLEALGVPRRGSGSLNSDGPA